nr:MAG TPA: hypothetical protein [Bacteriophage sp.]
MIAVSQIVTNIIILKIYIIMSDIGIVKYIDLE